MGESMSRILIKTTVRRYIRQMKESPERSIRNLLDMAVELADGRFQQDVFRMMRKMLENPGSAYYSLIQDATQHIDEERLLTYGMNAGYNSCTLGAEKIRSIEEKEHFNIPWTLTLQIGDEIPQAQYCSLIEQGERLGIYHWFLFSNGHSAACLDLASQFPESAFTVFFDPGEITWTVIDYASELYNLMLAVPLEDNADMVCSLLREAELLYSVYKPYDGRDIPAMESGDLFCEMEQHHGVFSGLVPKQGCPVSVREDAYKLIHSSRMEQTFATILWELHRDHLAVDKIISDDSCWGGFGPTSIFYTMDVTGKLQSAGCIHEPLEELLKRAFPKEAK